MSLCLCVCVCLHKSLFVATQHQSSSSFYHLSFAFVMQFFHYENGVKRHLNPFSFFVSLDYMARSIPALIWASTLSVTYYVPTRSVQCVIAWQPICKYAHGNAEMSKAGFPMPEQSSIPKYRPTK